MSLSKDGSAEVDFPSASKADLPCSSAVEPTGLSCHHCIHIPLAHEDGKDPDTLTKTSLGSLVVFEIFQKPT